MGYPYKAFISYRHCPFDIAVASKLRRFLETYQIPDALQKQEGKWVVFRDREELPLCNDLSEQIKKALQQSEYLIVICSTRLKDSKWCKEEIRYFKELHQGSTRNIIAVLIDGTPDECFPQEIRESDDDGIRRAVEPLAANIVSSSAAKSFRLLKMEYLRLAACMLGCSHDELYQRAQKRQQRLRLLTGGLLMSVLLLITAIVGSAALQLYRKNQELLYEQAEFITMQSQVLWEKGRPIESINLLCSVLPGKGEDAPVNVNAEYVLSQQIGAYEIEAFLPVRALEHQSPVRGVRYVGKGKNILTYDDDNLCFWSRDDFSLIQKYSAEDFGSYRFSVYVEERQYESAEIVDEGFDIDRPYTQVVFREGSYEIVYGDQVDPAIFLFDEYNIWKIDGETAQIIWHHACDRPLYDPTLRLTEEGLLVCGAACFLLDSETGALKQTGDHMHYTPGKMKYGSSIVQSEWIGEKICVARSDPEREAVLWATELPLSELPNIKLSCPEQIALIEKEPAENYCDVFVYSVMNYLCLLNADDGTMLAEYTFPAHITSVQSAKNGCLFLTDQNRTEYVIDAGHLSGPSYEVLPVAYVTNTFITDTDGIARYDGECLTYDEEVTEAYVYRNRRNPDYAEPLGLARYVLNPSGSYAVVEPLEENVFYVMDMTTLTPVSCLVCFDAEEATYWGFLDETKCFFTDDGATTVYDIEQGRICGIFQGGYYDASGDGKWLVRHSSRGYDIIDLEGNQLSCSSSAVGDAFRFALSEDAAYICYDHTDPDTGKTYLALYRMKDASTILLAEKAPDRMSLLEEIIWITDTEVAVLYSDDVIEIYDIEKKTLIRECDFGELLSARRSSLHMMGNANAVVVICENGKIYKLDLVAGELTAEINLFSVGRDDPSDTYAPLLKDPMYQVYSELYEEENLMVLILHVGIGWNDAWFLDLDSFSLRCKVPMYAGYAPKAGKILAIDPSRSTVWEGILPYYSTEELVERAENWIGRSSWLD